MPLGDRRFRRLGKAVHARGSTAEVPLPKRGLFARRKVQVTVKLPSGKSYSGDVVRIDDFTVTLRENRVSTAPSTA